MKVFSELDPNFIHQSSPQYSGAIVAFSIIGFILPALFTVFLIWLVIKHIKRQIVSHGQQGEAVGGWRMRRKMLRGNRWAAFFVFLFLGAGFLFSGGVDIFYNHVTQWIWNEAPAVVTDSSVESYSRKGRRRYEAIINYTYKIDARSYEGTYSSRRAGVGESQIAAEEKLARYPVGSTVKIRVNPKNPWQSVLPEKLGISTYFSAGLGIFLWGLGLFSLRKKKIPPQGAPPPSPTPTLPQIPKGIIPPPILK